MNHTNPDYDFLSDTDVNDTIQNFLKEINILTQYIFDSENLENKIINQDDEINRQLLILLKEIKFENNTNKTKQDLFNSFDGTFSEFISVDGTNRKTLQLSLYTDKDKGRAIKIKKGKELQDYNIHNLLILSDKFSMLKDGY